MAARPAGLLLTNRRALLIDASFDDKEAAQRPGKGRPGGDHQRQIERVSRITTQPVTIGAKEANTKLPKFWIAATEATLCSATITCTSPRADVPAK